jgi:hypothetical protein
MAMHDRVDCFLFRRNARALLLVYKKKNPLPWIYTWSDTLMVRPS